MVIESVSLLPYSGGTSGWGHEGRMRQNIRVVYPCNKSTMSATLTPCKSRHEKRKPLEKREGGRIRRRSYG